VTSYLLTQQFGIRARFAQAAKILNHSNTELAEIGEFFNQELFTPRPEPVLSDVEGRLRGAISESYFTGMPEAPFFLTGGD
jgi:hypothetical protein